MDATYRARQLAHIDECIALTECVPSDEARAAAEHVLSQPPKAAPQGDLPLKAA